MARLPDLLDLTGGDTQADRVVPPTGFTATLTLFTAGAMAFLAVFALALSLAAGRLAERWGDELATGFNHPYLGPCRGDAGADGCGAGCAGLYQWRGLGPRDDG